MGQSPWQFALPASCRAFLLSQPHTLALKPERPGQEVCFLSPHESEDLERGL